MKILIVSSSFFPKIDGSTRCVYDHARKLSESQYVCLFTRGVPGSKRREKIEGINVIRTKTSFRGGTFPAKAILFIEQALGIIMIQRKIGFHVIHAHGYVSALASLLCKIVFGVPLVVTTHGTELLWPKKMRWKGSIEVKLGLILERFILSRCDVVIAQSEGVMSYMLKLYGNNLRERIRIVPTGVDHKKFRVEGFSNGKVVLFVGALSEIKGLSCLIKSFADVHREIKDARLILVGSGPKIDYYRKLVSELNIEDAVNFLGPIRDDRKLLELYSKSMVVVLPSNVGGPVSCTLLEGMSCGRAVISTNVPGGIPDVLDGGAGILIEPEDPMELASKIKKLMNDEAYFKEISKNARTKVERYYTLDMMIENLLSIYRELVR